MKLKEWGAFVLLASIWGSSFYWIKIALEEIGPFMLVGLRLAFGVAGLLILMAVTRSRFPRDRRLLLAFFFASIVQTALPFVLISWGETEIDSGVASILNGTVPLFTIVIAHFWLHDEKISLSRVVGLIVGFAGVVLLMSRDVGPQGLRGDLLGFLGQLAVLIAAASYAIGITFARKHLQGQSPIVQSTLVLLMADALVWLITLGTAPTPWAVESPLIVPQQPITWFALAWLGLLGSCIAYILYFYLINSWGATRASVVTYVLPVIGLLLGILFLDEAVDWRLVAGSVLVFAGIAVVNARMFRRTKTAVPSPAR